MADAALFLGWGNPIPGREAKALMVFNEVMQYYGGLVQSGSIESFEPVILSPHGGDLAGFFLIRGSREKLNALKDSDEFGRHLSRAGLIVTNVGLVDAAIGASLAQGMGVYQQQLQELA